MNLYEISQEYQRSFDELSRMEGLDSQIISDTLAPVVSNFENKAINLTYYFRNLEAQAIAIKEAEEMMCKRRKSIESKIENLKNYLKREMSLTKINKIECPYFSISLSPSRDKVEILDASQIPNEFIREKLIKEPDKNKILQAGGCAGVEIQKSFSLRIT